MQEVIFKACREYITDFDARYEIAKRAADAQKCPLSRIDSELAARIWSIVQDKIDEFAESYL